MSKNKKISCGCDMKNSMIPMRVCTCVTICIRFQYKETDKMNFWIEEPFNSELFYNDPKAAGMFIEKLRKIAEKEFSEYTTSKQKLTRNTTDSTVKFHHKKS